jgi:hypothetical protein
MKTVGENLKDFSKKIKDLLAELIQTHSEIHRWNTPGNGVLVLGGDYAWRELQLEGKRVQSKVLNEYRHFHAIIKTLIQNQPMDQLSDLDEYHKTLLAIIEQNGPIYTPDKNAELNDAISALDCLMSLLDNLYESGEREYIFVVDTNALIYNPALENWSYSGIPVFTIALTPITLSELDALKINHKNMDVRKKAERLIKQIKDYRGRGRLSEGVPLRRNEITLKTYAKEPNMVNTLPWLQENNNDDRLLAYLIEIMRNNIRSKVILITRDINLQNKAEYARLPFLEPPD